MKKNVFIISILASLLPSAAMWAAVGDTFKSNSGSVEITYCITGDNTCEVGAGTGKYTTNRSIDASTEGAVVIPDKVTNPSDNKEYTVTAIGVGAFYKCASITSLSMGNSVTSIGDYAVGLCTKLTSVTLSSSLTEISDYAFGKSPIATINWPSTLISIGKQAFWNASFTSVELPSNLETLGKQAFYQCLNLTSVTIPSSVTTINEGAFSGCTSLKTITDNSSITTIPKQMFYKCSALESYTIGNTVTTIGDYAFQQSGLKSITIPSTVTTWPSSKYAFDGCTSLTEATVNCALVKGMFSGATGLKKVNITGAITAIPQSFFKDCTALEDVTIPETVTRIHEYAFYNTGLKSITIPASVEVVEGYSFQNCKSLSSVTFAAGSKLNTIYNYCFFGCSALTSIALPSSIQSVEPYSFSQTGLTNIDFGGVKTIKANAFSNCGGLTTLNIPEGVTELGDYAFKGCTNLTSVAVPNTVTSLGSYLFQGCTGITSFAIPSHIKSIGAYTFAKMTGLTEITLPSTLESMGEGAFSGCTGVNKLTIEDGLANIPQKAFEGCTGIKNVVIPSSVKSIGMNAFSGCSAMEYIDLRSATNVTLSKFMRNSSHSAFQDVCYGLPVSTVVYLPKGFEQPATLFHDDINDVDDEIINYVFTDASDAATCPDYQFNAAKAVVLPYGFTATKATATRSFTAQQKSTVYLPFAIGETDAAGLGKFYEFDKVDGDVVSFKSATATEGGKAYLFEPASALTEIVANDVEVLATSADETTEGLKGVYEETVITDGLDKIYFWAAADGAFSNATSKLTVPPTRAYLQLSSAVGNARMMVSFDGESTGIATIGSDGRMDIQTVYDLQGRCVSSPVRGGLYIVGGKKMVF